MFKQASRIEIDLPAWLSDFVNDPSDIRDMNDRMAFVIEASRRNIEKKTGGPFAAAVFEKDSGKLISLGVNLVPSQRLSVLRGNGGDYPGATKTRRL